jgi:hypothetical protein
VSSSDVHLHSVLANTQSTQSVQLIECLLHLMLADSMSVTPSLGLLSLLPTLMEYSREAQSAILPPQLLLPLNVSTAHETAQAYSKLPNLCKKRKSDLDPYSGGERSGKKAKKDASKALAQHKAAQGLDFQPGADAVIPSSVPDTSKCIFFL